MCCIKTTANSEEARRRYDGRLLKARKRKEENTESKIEKKNTYR
jgi:hypothetical protein